MPIQLIEKRFDVRRFALIAIASMLLLGCASSKTTPEARVRSDVTTAKDTTRTKFNGAYKFTVNETVRIGSDVRNDYQKAVLLLKRDQLSEGIELLESVVERAPDITIPQIDLGVAYRRLGDDDKAEQSLFRALSLAPNHPVALNEMGILYRRTGKFHSARDHYERALAVHPHYHFALRNLGVLCDLYLEDLECALEQYERYAEFVADDPAVTIWIADIRNRLGLSGQE